MKKSGMFTVMMIAVALLAMTAFAAAEEPVHEHVWSADYRTCTDCGEMHPCWDEEKMLHIHEFDGDSCSVCGTALYCGIEGHERDEDHIIGECGIPGHFVCDELDHDEVYGNGFDPDGHRKCLEEVAHVCEDCGATYLCDRSNSHVVCIVCGDYWCNKEDADHTEEECGCRECEVVLNKAAHAECEGCGGYLCDGKDHSACTVEEEPVEDDPIVEDPEGNDPDETDPEDSDPEGDLAE